jgi:hypothetical protein
VGADFLTELADRVYPDGSPRPVLEKAIAAICAALTPAPK